MNHNFAIGATVVSGVLALFVPFLSALISGVLVAKLKRTNDVWGGYLTVANIVIAIVNLAITAFAIASGHMLGGIA